MPVDPKRAQDVFLLAADAPDRPAVLARECGGDADLRRRVEGLLAAHDDPGSFLARPAAADPGATGDHAGPGEDIGTVVAGRYKLLERIGEGGMGSVWMAEQREPVRRLVALKLVKPGMDTKQVLARFEAERQALALMDHPNIAKVLDGGSTDAGRPFFVMELVKGLPLTEYADERRLSVRDRLDLFVQICSAVQHAHQKGVIHRDLKPSNILVTEHDGKPVPKVIDFGLAKALHATSVLTEKTLHTAFGAVVGTPLYMAPEQVGINALDVDTRTDVYALGVMLYELLTGSTPIDRERLNEAMWDEVRRLIREEEPPRPSVRLSSSDALPSLAATRRAEPKRLTGLVRGELDWIVMKALEKDRTRRYESATGLAADVQRHLAGEPVQAVPPTATYRVRKFVRRNRAAVLVAAAFLLLIHAGATGVYLAYLRAVRAEAAAVEQAARVIEERNRATDAAEAERAARAAEADQRARAEGEKKRADEEAAVARAVSDFLRADLLGQADPANQDGGAGGRDPDVKVRTLLDRAGKAVAGKFPGQPLTEAGVRQAIGGAYLALGRYPDAQPHLERAAALYAAELGPSHLDAVKSKSVLAHLYRHQGQLGKAEPLYAEALRECEARYGPDHEYTLTAKANMAHQYHAQLNAALAWKLHTEVLAARTAKLGPDHPDTVRSKSNLAGLCGDIGRLDLAERLNAEVLAANAARHGPNHPATIDSKARLAGTYRYLGRLDRADELLAEAHAAAAAALGSDHLQTVEIKHQWAIVVSSRRRYDEAERLFTEALAGYAGQLGADHRSVLACKDGLAMMYAARGDPDRAIRLHADVVRMTRAKYGRRDLYTVYFTHHWIAALERAGRRAEAADLRVDILPAEPHRFPPGDPELGAVLAEHAQALLAAGRPADAEPAARRSLAIREATQPAAWTTFNSRALLGGALLGQKKYAEAEPLLAAGYAGLKARTKVIPPNGKRNVSQAGWQLALLYDLTGRPEKAAAVRAELPRETAPPPRPGR